MDMTSSYVKTDDSSVVTDNDSCVKSDGDEDDAELYDNHPKVSLLFSSMVSVIVS